MLKYDIVVIARVTTILRHWPAHQPVLVNSRRLSFGFSSMRARVNEARKIKERRKTRSEWRVKIYRRAGEIYSNKKPFFYNIVHNYIFLHSLLKCVVFSLIFTLEQCGSNVVCALGVYSENIHFECHSFLAVSSCNQKGTEEIRWKKLHF